MTALPSHSTISHDEIPRHTLSVAVIGAGRWGTVHGEKLKALPGVHVAGVIDPDLLRARRLAHHLGDGTPLPFGAHLDDLPERPAGAVVAVPLRALAPVAQMSLSRGVHTLVEKPGAMSPGECEALVAESRRRGVGLAVGYLERFNPTLASVPSRPQRIVARRSGPPRPGGAPLHLDWLVHDLDLALHLMGPSLKVQGVSSAPDHVEIRLEGADGRAARLTSTHRALSVRRRLWADGVTTRLSDGRVADPLARQLVAFVSMIRTGHWPEPLARGEHALRVLRMVAEVAPSRPAAA
ncbi:MAG: Gfo/Idh/MocA family protein [Bradymonadia bacterium]